MAGGGADAGAGKSPNLPTLSRRSPARRRPLTAVSVLGEVRIRSGHFGADVRAARNALGQPQPDAIAEFGAPASTCAAGIAGEGTVVAATYDGAAAALVLRPAAGDVQVVDLYLCDTTEPARSITLTVPLTIAPPRRGTGECRSPTIGCISVHRSASRSRQS